MSSNYYSLVDIARGIKPQNSRLPETPSPIDNDDFRTAANSSPSPASPVASPAASPLLRSALSALGSPAQQALHSSDDAALIEEVSELGTESDADSLRISPDSYASPAHETPNLRGRVSTAQTTPEAPLAADTHREAPPRLVMFGSSFASAAARIPGMQSLGDLWHAMPSTQTILNRPVPQPLPASSVPTNAQMQDQILEIDEDVAPHILINMPQSMIPDEPDDGSDSSDSSSSSSSSSRFRESATGSSFSGIISERDSPVPDELDIPARSAAACRPVETYLHLGLAPPRPNPIQAAVATPELRAPQPSPQVPTQAITLATLATLAQQFLASMHPGYIPENSALTQARVTVTHGGSSEHRGSAQADRDILRPVGDDTVEFLPAPIMNAVQGVIAHTSAGAIALAQAAGQAAGAAAKRAATGFMNGFNGVPVTHPQPATAPAAAASATAQGVAHLSDILNLEQPSTAAPAVTAAPQAASTALGLGTFLGVAVRDLATGAVTGFLTGAAPSLTAANAAAPAATTPQGFFSQIFTGLRNTATKQFTELRFAGIAVILAEKVAGMEESTAKTQLNEMLTAIERFQKGEITQDTLELTLTQIMNGQDETGRPIRDILHIHLNRLELPIRTEGVGTALESLEATQAAHPRTPETTLPADEHQRRVGLRQAQLVTNISTMAPLNLVNEWLCGGLLKKEKIAEILGTNRNASDYHTVVRKAFYAELNNLFFLRRWAAKFTYWAFSGLSSTILSSFIQGILGKVQSSVNAETSQRQQAVHTAVITEINGGLTAYNDAIAELEKLRKNHSVELTVDDSDTMLGAVLAKPRYNGDQTKETLYNKAIDKAVDDILPSLGWTESLKEGLRKLPIYAKALLFPLTFIARVVVGSTEWISDLIIRSVIRNVVKYTKILDTVIDLSVDQVSKNGYTHAINKLVLQQLILIGEALDKPDSEASTSSMANKQELRKLAKELFNTLETQRRDNQQVGTDPATTLENFKRSAYQLTSDFSADAIALIIDQAKNIILDPKMIAMRQDSLLEALNAALESSTTATDDDMLALEEEIMRESDIILNKALKKIVHATLEHKPTEVQEACNRFTKKIKDKATGFVTQLINQLGDRRQFETSIAEFTATMIALLKEAQNAPLLEDSAASIDLLLITPIANIMRGLNSQLGDPELRAALDGLDLLIRSIPEITHLDAQITGSAIKQTESITCKLAYQGGKVFFNEAWKLLTKKPVWRFAAHRAMLSFIRN